VPRAAFTLREKLKYGLKNCLDKITQLFKVAGDYSNNKEEFETTFAYMEYTVRKHINDTIGPKHEEIKQNHKRNDGPGPSKIKMLLEEMEEIRKKRNYILNLTCRITELSLELKEWLDEEPTLGYRNKYYASISKILELCEALEENDKQEEPSSIISSERFREWVAFTNIEEWRIRTEKHYQTSYDEKYHKLLRQKNVKLQRDFTDDSKRTVRKITVDQSPICKIPPEKVEEFWKGRWEQCPDFDSEKVNSRCPIKKFFNTNMNKEMLEDLFSVEKMMALISKRGNLSAPGLDGITFPFLKLEKESAVEMIVEMLKYMILKK
jgi:hypothetical protein